MLFAHGMTLRLRVQRVCAKQALGWGERRHRAKSRAYRPRAPRRPSWRCSPSWQAGIVTSERAVECRADARVIGPPNTLLEGIDFRAVSFRTDCRITVLLQLALHLNGATPCEFHLSMKFHLINASHTSAH